MDNYKAVIFDLAGTLIDHGSCAPVAAFVDLFHAHGIKVDASLVRSYMGLGKREHLEALLQHPRVMRLSSIFRSRQRRSGAS